jgi:hypothetical protein
MSVSSFRRNSRVSSANTFRSEDFSPSSASTSSFESELESIRTDINRSLQSIRNLEDSKTGSKLFIKPPVVPPRKKLVLNDNEQPIHNKLLLNDSIFSESTDLNSPKVQILNPIIPAEKIAKCEQVIQNLLNEYNVSGLCETF